MWRSVLCYTGKINGSWTEEREHWQCNARHWRGWGSHYNGDVSINTIFLPSSPLLRWPQSPRVVSPRLVKMTIIRMFALWQHSDTTAVLNLTADARICLDNANIFQCLTYFVLVETTDGTAEADIMKNKHPERQLIFLGIIDSASHFETLNFQDFKTFIWWKLKGFKLKLIKQN